MSAPDPGLGPDPDLSPIDESEEVEVQDVDPDLEVMPITYDITSYGADYDVHGLVRRIENGDIVIPSFEPGFEGTDEVRGFQRDFVWRLPQMSRFIESLLLGLPVPGVFLVKTTDNKLLVLDGQQRLGSLAKFYSGWVGDRKFRLKGVQEPWNGLTFADLEPEDRRRLDDSIIHATILRQESDNGHQDAIYSIYERLNTGGSPLRPQEIRIALFAGPFLNGISRLNAGPAWRNLYGAPSQRFRDHELILRVLAFYEKSDSYRRPLKAFLNEFLSENQERSLAEDAPLARKFSRAVELLNNSAGPRIFRPERALNAAYVDSITTAAMHALDSGRGLDNSIVELALHQLESDRDFKRATLYDTSAEDAVQYRLQAARTAFRAT